MSNVTMLLQALLNGEDIGNYEPKSRMEAYLKNCCLASGTGGLPEPITETDALLYQLAEKISDGVRKMDVLKAIIGGTEEEIHDDCATRIKDYTFYRDSIVKSVDFQNVISIGYCAFAECSSIISANFPNAKDIGELAFWFEEFEPSLTYVNFEKVINIGSQAFSNCRALPDIRLPEATNIEYAAFESCISLKTIYIPKITAIERATFFNCCELYYIDLPKVTRIEKQAFWRCEKLKTLILRNDSGIVSLGNISAFDSTPFASGGTGGTVYVPASLVEEYKTATNWSTLYNAGTCNFLPIEGSEYE